MEEENPFEGLEQITTLQEKKAKVAQLQRDMKLYNFKTGAEISKTLHEMYPNAPKPSDTFLTLVLQHVVLDGVDVKDAIQITLKEVGRDMDWYNRIRYKNITFAAEVVDFLKRRKGFEALVKQGRLKVKALRHAKDTQTFLNQVSEAQQIMKELEDKDKKLKELEDSIHWIVLKNYVKAWAVSNDFKCVPDLEDRDNLKSLVVFLNKVGYRPKELLYHFDIPERTLYRWLEK